MLLAGVAYALLAGQVVAGLPWVAAAALLTSYGLAKVSLPLGLTPALILAYLSPALLMVGFGVADYHQILVWLALLAGPIVAAGDWSRWHLPLTWKGPLAAWAVIIAVTWPIIAGREIDFSLIAARTLDTPNGLLGGPPPLTAAWITSVALAQLLAILWLDLLWARFGPERLRRAERAILVPLAISASLGAVAGLYQRYGDINWLNVGDWPSLGRAGGLMLDANSFGTAAAIWAPLSIALVWRLGRPFVLGALFAAVLVAGMWASGSRTALLAAVVGFIAVAIALSHRARAWQARFAPVVLLLVAAVLVLVVATQSDDRSNPLTRVLDILPRAETGGLTRLGDELWNRNGYGIAATAAIADHPATGLGIGAFNQLSTDYFFLSSGAVIPPDNAQNWWRQQIVELGFVGALPSLVFSVIVLFLIGRGYATGTHRDPATVIRGVIVGLGLASLFGLATQHPALLITFVTLLYWLGALVEGGPASPLPSVASRLAWVVVLVIAAVVAAGQWQSAHGNLRVPVRALRVGFPYAYGFSAAENDAALGPVRFTGSYAVGVLRAEHAYFDLTAWPSADAASAPVQVRMWRGDQLIADAESTGTPVRRIIAVPTGQRFLMVAMEASRTSSEGRGLKISGRWIRELPGDATPDIVVP